MNVLYESYCFYERYCSSETQSNFTPPRPFPFSNVESQNSSTPATQVGFFNLGAMHISISPGMAVVSILYIDRPLIGWFITSADGVSNILLSRPLGRIPC